MKLNLGCGGDLQEGYLNIDLTKPSKSNDGKSIDEFEFRESDVSNLNWLEDESVSEIRAQDIIDHIHWKDLETTLQEWRRVLKTDSYLYIRYIPDFEKSAMKYFKSERKKEDWIKFQKWVDRLSYDVERYRCKNLIDFGFFKNLLEMNGFVIEKYWYEDDEELNIDCKKKEIVK